MIDRHNHVAFISDHKAAAFAPLPISIRVAKNY